VMGMRVSPLGELGLCAPSSGVRGAFTSIACMFSHTAVD
jgi:hypothetical protein